MNQNFWFYHIKGISEKIERICSPLNVKVNFQSLTTLRKLLVHVKQAIPMEKKKGVVYSIPCMNCNSVYVGETGRNLEKQLKEHQYAVNRMDNENGISVHAWKKSHRVNWDESRVLKMIPNYFHRRLTEALIIQSSNTTSNLDKGLELNSTWTPFLQEL